MPIKKIIQTIKAPKRFLISTHVNPDPDAICSELGMAMYLRSLGKEVLIVNEEETPKRFHFLPGIQRIKGYKKKMRYDYDAAVVLDCGELKRVGEVRSLIRKDRILINIDHHVTNDLFGHFNLVDPQASSTTEILYTLLKRARHRFTRDLALNLYAGMMTDTGSFRYENTTAYTHQAAGDLMRFGFSASRLYGRVYETIAPADMRELVKLISRFEPLCGGRAVCLSLSKKISSGFSEGFDLRDALFNFLRPMQGVEVFVIFTELDRRRTRVNLRSVRTVDVARLAQYFAGGGHPRASGCTILKNMRQAREDVIRQMRKVL